MNDEIEIETAINFQHMKTILNVVLVYKSTTKTASQIRVHGNRESVPDGTGIVKKSSTLIRQSTSQTNI